MAVPQVGGGPGYEFKPRISFPDGTMLAEHDHLHRPAGLPANDVPKPNFVDPTAMVSMLHSVGGHGNGLGIVHGLTVPEYAVAFADIDKQWQQVGSGPFPKWKFQGGDVFLDVKLTVYILEGDRPRPKDEASRKIYAIIMEHELLHVLDEVDIATRWMPPKARKDEMVVKYLANAEPVDDHMFQNWFKGSGFTDWLTNGLWNAEHDRRKQLRDSAHEYTTQGDRIADLRIEIANRPSR